MQILWLEYDAYRAVESVLFQAQSCGGIPPFKSNAPAIEIVRSAHLGVSLRLCVEFFSF